MNISIRHIISELESIRNNRLIVYFLTKHITDQDVSIVYECLNKLGSADRLDLFLYTTGGSVNAARRIALLLRDYTKQLNILVPYKARSAGTVLCLAADQLVLAPLAELSPLDPQIGSVDDLSTSLPTTISSEDVRAFRHMAEEWFGVRSESDRMQVFGLLSQHVFPLSLSTFFRADRQMYETAEELLHYQLGDVDGAVRKQIVGRLITGYHSHEYCITRAEAQALGLRVISASAREEYQMWSLLQLCRRYPFPAAPEQLDPGGRVEGIICSADFSAHYLSQQRATRMEVEHNQEVPAVVRRIEHIQDVLPSTMPWANPIQEAPFTVQSIVEKTGWEIL